MRMRWIALAAIVLAGALLAVAAWRAGTPRPAGMPLVGAPADSIAQALRQARGGPAGAVTRAIADTAADKSRWVPEVRGFDVSDLAPARRAMFVRFANAQRCTCGCGYTLAGCRAYDPTCPVSGPRVGKLLDSVRAGRVADPPRARPSPSRGG